MKRIESIDIVRGVVMVIMALDHVRDLMHVNSIAQSPTDLTTTTPLLFFTRLITHLCAPTFVFLAGTSAYLVFRRGGDTGTIRKSMIKRGLWLILLEFTVVNFALFFDIRFHTMMFEVIAAIGLGFILLALLLKLKPNTLGMIGLAIIFLHNLLPLIPFSEGSVVRMILAPLFGPAAFPLSPNMTFVMGYPPIPWLGIMLVGFASGRLFELETATRKGVFLKIGLCSLLFFVLLRFVNIYGDAAWSVQKDGIYTLLSFLNITKYPPSLLFCAFTLGLMFLSLAFAEQAKYRFTHTLSTYGKVPLFYFIVHFYLIHVLLLIILLMQGFQWSELDFASGSFGRPKGVESGVSLGIVYLIWIGVVLALYLPCKWFANYKASHSYWWLKYV